MRKAGIITGSIYILAAILNFGLNLILIPQIGIIGAAVTTLIAYLFIFIVGTFYSFKYLKLDIDYRFILKGIFASLVMSLVILRWDPVGLQSVLAAIGVGAVVYAAVLLLLRGMTKEEIIFFKSIFRI